MNKATFHELVDKYLNGAMTDTEVNEFELTIKNDEMLQKEFNVQKSIRKGIVLHARKSLIEDLTTVREELSQGNLKNNELILTAENDKNNDHPINQYTKIKGGKAAVIKFSTTWFSAIAASVLLIIGSVFLFQTSTSTMESKTFIGEFAVKIHPEEGKLGSPGSIVFQLYHVKSGLNYYDIKGDSIILYTSKNPIDITKAEVKNMILNENRNLVIESNHQVHLIKPKFDSYENL